MGKRKKKKSNDTRGYSTKSSAVGSNLKQPPKPTLQRKNTTVTSTTNKTTSSSSTSIQTVKFSTKSHDGLTKLLDDLKELNISQRYSKNITHVHFLSKEKKDFLSKHYSIFNTRFCKKIEVLNDQLEELHFTYKQIEKVMIEMVKRQIHTLTNENVDVVHYYSYLSLNHALDWLCLNLSTDDLPKLFTEVSARQEEEVPKITIVKNKSTNLNTFTSSREKKQSVGDNNEVENKATKQRKIDVKVDSTLTAPDSINNKKGDLQRDTNDKDNDVKRKNWILEQYQYLEEDDEEEKEVIKESVTNQEDMDPQEILLQNLQEQILSLKQTVNDDVSNYMRSKKEIAQLKKELKQLENQSKKLSAKIAKKKQTRAEEEAMKAQESNEREEEQEYGILGFAEEGEDGGGMFDLFSEEEEYGNITQVEATTDTEKEEVVDDTLAEIFKNLYIPGSWTGQTPKQILIAYCRKQEIPKPKYSPPSSLKIGTLISLEVSRCEDEEMTQHYLSTKALYELEPNSNLYHVFPPSFKQLWKSWLSETFRKGEVYTEEIQKARDLYLSDLIQSVCSEVFDNQYSDQNIDMFQIKEEDKSRGSFQHDMKTTSWNESVNENWDDSDHDSDAPPQQMKPKIDKYHSIQKKRFEETKKTKIYQNMLSQRKKLPMYAHREVLLELVSKNSVIILCGETGSGKTTQCPQFLLENLLSFERNDGFIICTQPRRISCLTVSERVAEECCSKDEVGYQIRNESTRTSKTKLLFCTTGIILRKLQQDPNLSDISHIVVDEVHERQWQIDFLLIILRNLLMTTRKHDLKVILMSATLDSKLFCKFFKGVNVNGEVPFLSVKGRTYPVSEYFLEDVLDATNHLIEDGSQCSFREERSMTAKPHHIWVSGKGGQKLRQTVDANVVKNELTVSDEYKDYKMTTRISMERVNEEIINYDLIEDLLSLLLLNKESNSMILPPISPSGTSEDGSVLVFFPGKGEIKRMKQILDSNRTFQDFDIIPMHSSLSSKEQKKAFLPSKKRKIILSTNICETSVTIPDCSFVIDTGLEKEIVQNKTSFTSTLVTKWCSRASSKQRSGRAGRVRSGICCRLYSSKTYQNNMKDQNVPEIQRLPLEEVCLNILSSAKAEVKQQSFHQLNSRCIDFLQQAPQPPDESAVNAALDILYEVGAIKKNSNENEYSGNTKNINTHNLQQERIYQNETLTPLGIHLSKLPVHVKLGKMLIFGCLFKVLDKTLTIAASLSATKSPFLADKYQNTDNSFVRHSYNDFLTFCNVHEQFLKILSEKNEGHAKKFCEKNHLNYTVLNEITDLKREFLSLLKTIGFVSSSPDSLSYYNVNGKKDKVVSAIICAGLFPNIAHLKKKSIEENPSGRTYELWHHKERLSFRPSSVNHPFTCPTNTKTPPSNWIVFHEKFATKSLTVTTSVDTTTFISPFSLLLFGRSSPIQIQHLERKVCLSLTNKNSKVWTIELLCAAQTGLLFRELRKSVDFVLEQKIQSASHSNEEDGTKNDIVLNGIVKLLEFE